MPKSWPVALHFHCSCLFVDYLTDEGPVEPQLPSGTHVGESLPVGVRLSLRHLPLRHEPVLLLRRGQGVRVRPGTTLLV